MTSEVRTRSETGGEKGSKPQQIHQIPPEFLLGLSEVYSHAQETKYKDVSPGVPNWSLGYPWSLSYSAMMRHLMAFWKGEYYDPEDGLPHLLHAAWHCATLYTWHEEGIGLDKGYDDRPKYYSKPAEPVDDPAREIRRLQYLLDDAARADRRNQECIRDLRTSLTEMKRTPDAA